MRSVILRMCFLMLGLALAGPLYATTERVVEVTQPILTEEGIWLSATARIVMVGTPVPGLEVSFTCAPTQLKASTGHSDHNAASLAGLRVTVLRPTDVPPQLPEGDTMVVVLDTSHARRVASPVRASLDTTIRATIDAIRENADRAASRWPSLTRLTIIISGPRARQRTLHYAIHPLKPRRQYCP